LNKPENKYLDICNDNDESKPDCNLEKNKNLPEYVIDCSKPEKNRF